MGTSIESQFKDRNIVIMAGGTGGHVFPALAVAKALAEKGANISWLGTARGIEAKVIPEHFPLDLIKVKGIRNKKVLAKLGFPFQLLGAVFNARQILKDRKANLVIGFGGYASGPGALAAKLLSVPILIHEQNAKAGATNRYLAKIAKEVMCAFPCQDFSKAKVTVVGNPIRAEILKIAETPKNFDAEKLNCLIVGGSLGAEVLNKILPHAFAQLGESIRPQVWHQTGEAQCDATTQSYKDMGVEAKVTAFIDGMAEAYGWADIIICRAGASTVSEVAVMGLPAIFIPYPHAVDDHQFHNTEILTRSKAASCIRQENLTPEKLAAFIQAWHSDRQALREASQHAKGVALFDSTENILKIVSKHLA